MSMEHNTTYLTVLTSGWKNNIMRRIIFLIFIVVLSLSVLGAGCTQPPVTETSTPETALVQEPVVELETTSVQKPIVPPNTVIKIETTDWGWIPEVITIETGETITLEITNTGRMPHGIWIPELGINEGVRSGKTVLVDIVAPSNPAEFAIKCNDPECGTMEQHNGMAAMLTITE